MIARAFCVSIRCEKCKDQIGFKGFSYAVSTEEALKSFKNNSGRW